jgi:sortase family protein
MIAVVAVVVGATTAWGARGGAEPGRDGSSARVPVLVPDASPAPVTPAARVGAPRPEVPTRMMLPNGTVVPIRAVGTAADGSLDVPDDIRVAGWWRGGARLGDPFGSTLVAAHVDSYTQGLGPYASLLAVRAGQRIGVSSAHLSQTFAVVSLRVWPRASLGRHPGIFSARGARRLTLVTCSGPFLAEHGGYQNLAVITARPLHAVSSGGTR